MFWDTNQTNATFFPTIFTKFEKKNVFLIFSLIYLIQWREEKNYHGYDRSFVHVICLLEELSAKDKYEYNDVSKS